MAATLEAVHRDDVRAHALGSLRVLDRHALVDHHAAVVLEELDPLTGVAPSGLHDADPLLDHDLGIGPVVRRRQRGQEGQVHANRLLRQRLALADLRAELACKGGGGG